MAAQNPSPYKFNYGRKPRPCLKCGKKFNSAGSFNRICPNCNNVNKASYSKSVQQRESTGLVTRGSIVRGD